ncbi:MAG: Xaa-Pro peptidase family protein [Melioribacteraceae bacterium]|nr:Xaa-Pro peptidase family protein [Melioribacteraceae bacterium]MCO6474631.1 aminopeptidase P family protein [Melioribacteraceae bacterium]MDD3557620.1 Xaa-Pro peptidase family protein [Melioribacteraceae bacterium]
MSKEMILEKQKQAVQILNEKDIDMWLTFVRETGSMKDPMMDMIAGTGATWSSAFIITKNGDTTAIIGSLEEANMKIVGTFKNIVSYLKSIKEDLLKVLKSYDPKTIAVNYSLNSALADGLTHGMYLELMDHLKDTPYKDRLVSSEDIIAALRGRKSATEIDLMKTAIVETLKIFDEVTDFIKVGKTEKEVAEFVKSIVKERGFGLAWDEEHCPAVFTGPDTAGAHSGPTDKKIEKGHVINMDFGINYKGYCSDLQRTWYVLKDGEKTAPAEVQKGFQVIVDSIQKSAEAIKPGVQGCTIDDIARNHIVENGYPEYPHALGHQVGRAAHDGGGLLAPRWERYGKLPYIPIEVGNVFTIEPRLPIQGFGIATIEEKVVVTKDGCEFISPPQKEIILIKG